MKQEFDQYIDDYRSNCDKSLSLSGETSAYFAEYKAKKLAEWLPSLVCRTRPETWNFERSISQPTQILDFGCGDGTMTNFVQKSFPLSQVYGVDPSPKSIETARKQFDRIHFSINSEESTKIEFANDFFDLIYSAGVFHHIPFIHHENYLEELVRSLKPGGYLVLFELNPLNPLTVLTFKRNPIDKNARMMWPSYTSRLTKKYGKTSTKFYCFYPKSFSWLRPTEPLMTKIPFGALYATLTKKRFLEAHS